MLAFEESNERSTDMLVTLLKTLVDAVIITPEQFRKVCTLSITVLHMVLWVKMKCFCIDVQGKAKYHNWSEQEYVPRESCRQYSFAVVHGSNLYNFYGENVCQSQ